jgi:hypothetical protein
LFYQAFSHTVQKNASWLIPYTGAPLFKKQTPRQFTTYAGREGGLET